jgi:serine/threonine-protein kinase
MSPHAPFDPVFVAFQSALAGRYSIDREIGRGGMGIVYLAKEVHLDRSVAIKLLPPDRAAQPALRERFLREARLAAKLSHPNIIPIHAVDETVSAEDGARFVFYVMAYIDGETLADRVQHRGPLGASDGARVLREVAWALGNAHDQGLVHRDVKPDNIMIEHATGRVLVTDFGIAAASREVSTDGVSGTPEFMSPEQALGKEVDGRSDVYSLGATAYFTFSGRLPFEGDSATEIIAKHVTSPPPPIASLGVGVPRRIALLIDRCLAKEVDQRPESAQRVADGLTAALEQRRDLPVALREFVKTGGRLNGAGTMVYPFALLGGSIATGLAVSSGILGWTGNGVPLAIGLFATGMVAAPLAACVANARRLLHLGFDQRDLEPAFNAELELAREEIQVRHRTLKPSPLDTALRPLRVASSWAAGILLPTSIGLDFLSNSLWTLGRMSRILLMREIEPFVTAFMVGSVLVCLSTTIMHVIDLSHRTDIDTEFWRRMWTGRLGRALFGLAKRITGGRKTVAANTHRPTELSLGLAVEALFESLPTPTRESIGDVPAMARLLEHDATRLRATLDALNEALTSINEAAHSSEYAAVRDDRDAVQAKLRDVVAAMETIRLNLLRLHAGSTTVESFTTHVGLASDISADVERLLVAQRDVERVVRFPCGPVPTPA